MKLGHITKALRELNGWGAPELAKRASAAGSKKVNYQSIQQLEQKPDMSPSYLAQLAAAFEKSIDDLLSWRPGMPHFGPNSPSYLDQPAFSRLAEHRGAKPISHYDATLAHPSPPRLPRVQVRGIAFMDKAGFWTELADDPEGNGYFSVVTDDPDAYFVRIRGGDIAVAMSGSYVLLLPGIRPEPGMHVLVKLKDGRSTIRELVSHTEGEYRLQASDGSRMLLAEGEVEYLHFVAGTMMPGLLKR